MGSTQRKPAWTPRAKSRAIGLALGNLGGLILKGLARGNLGGLIVIGLAVVGTWRIYFVRIEDGF